MNRTIFALSLFVITVAIGVFALGAFWERDPSWRQQSSTIFPAGSSAQLSAVIEDVLTSAALAFTSSDTPQEYSASSSEPTGSKPTVRWVKHDYSVSLDDRSQLARVTEHLSDAITAHGGDILQTYVESKQQQAQLVIGVGTFITHHIVFTWTPVMAESPPAVTDTSTPQFRAAIVIDDLGTNMLIAQRLLDLPADLTFSILPQLEKSTQVARLLHDHQREFFLHLPMEPLQYPAQNPGKGAIMTNMGAEQIRMLIDRDLQTVPFASGVNNHMGSRFTADWEAMKVVLEHLRSRQLNFMDSRTTGRSIAYKLAQQLGIKSAQKKLFLDNEANVAAVKIQLEKLAALAEQGGEPAIAIGHPKEATLQALQEMLPEFERRNIQIVRVSNFLK